MRKSLKDWAKVKPNALLINRSLVGGFGKYFPKGTAITSPRQLEVPTKFRYESHYPDGEPYFMMGSRCPYICDGEFNYSVTVLTIYGGGTTYPVTEEIFNDPNWEDIESLEDAAY